MKTETVEEALQVITDYLKKGNAIMHGFRSGGGLRVFRIERTLTLKKERGGLLFYGEGVNCDDAFRILADDIKAGKTRPYNEVYGTIEPHYLTGTSVASSALDKQILQGRAIDVWVTEKDKFCAVISGLEQVKVSEEVCNRAKVSKTGAHEWTSDRGYVYETCTSCFPNGDPAFSTRVVSVPPGGNSHRAWMYDVKHQGKGDTVAEAIEVCLAAPGVEVVLPKKVA